MVSDLHQLYQFKGHNAQFWPLLLSFARRQLQAEHAWLLRRRDDDSWTTLLGSGAQSCSVPATALQRLADSCLKDNPAVSVQQHQGTDLFARLIPDSSAPRPCVAIFACPQQSDEVTSKQSLLDVIATLPQIRNDQLSAATERLRSQGLASILELVHKLGESEEFKPAAMLCVNEIAALFHCQRVSLGWLKKGYIRLQSISHMDSFDAAMERVVKLEAAMEECSDQNEEVSLPATLPRGPVDRDHQQYAALVQQQHVISLPLRSADQVLGVITCERGDRPFQPGEIIQLRVLCDQLAAPLRQREKTDRLFSGRLSEKLHQSARALVGPHHSGLKLSAVAISLILLASLLISLPYRVEAPFILRSQDVRRITAPIDGFISRIDTELGLEVAKEQLLMQLDQRELVLQESAALANQLRFEREAEQARARNALIEMKIAVARADQAAAEVARIRLHLEQTAIRSPIQGRVVENLFEEKNGAAVNQGEPLFIVAAGERLYADLAIDEGDLQYVATRQIGELAFVSHPGEQFAFTLKRISPAATKDSSSGNVFAARSNDLSRLRPWWRPGLSGIAKIDVGHRSLLWIMTHKTIRTLRLLAWW